MKNPIKELYVDLGERAYPIFIGENILLAKLLQKYIRGEQIFIITNQTIANIYLEALTKQLNHYECNTLILPDGESYKNLQTLGLVFDALVTNRHLRTTTLIALGGGVIGDLTGFAAACYQRGVSFVQIPTSLLAQVDASVGGKTAINHPLGKNMIGAFHQPKAVFIDIKTLKTLPQREFNSGLAEIIKAALIADGHFFNWLENNIENILNQEQIALIHAIEVAVNIKVKIVIADEKEQNIRAWLNLGHTFAHGIEQLLGYGIWLHGEAVSVGLVLAAILSKRLGLINQETVDRIEKILTMAKLPIRLPQSLSAVDLINAMSTDKKKASADLTFILLKNIGQVVQRSSISKDLLKEIIEQIQ